MSDNFIKPNPYVEKHDYYQCDSGLNSKNNDLGKTYYRINCGNNDGFGFYENGQYILQASNVAIEKLGRTIEKNDPNDFVPAKIILADNGDIYFEAKNGDVIIKGNNIIMSATGSNIEKEGHVMISANATFAVDANTISMVAQEDGVIGAKNTMTVVGALGMNISGSLCSINDADSISEIVEGLSAVIAGGGFDVTRFLNLFKNSLETFFKL